MGLPKIYRGVGFRELGVLGFIWGYLGMYELPIIRVIVVWGLDWGPPI